MHNSIMCHLVAGYPNKRDFQKIVKEISNAGVDYIEIQIPFSDPIADGSAIMEANDDVLKDKMTLAESFSQIRRIDSKNIFIMTYLQKIHFLGIEKFCNELAALSCVGIIVPDLPYDSLEFIKLNKVAKRLGINIVPVISPGMSIDRLNDIITLKSKYIYVTSQKGITGSHYKTSNELNELIDILKNRSSAHIFIGFGISKIQDIKNVLTMADTAIIGSAIIRYIQQYGTDKTIEYVSALVNGS